MVIDKDAIAQFESRLSEEEKSRATIEKYIHDVKGFVGFLNGEEATKMKILEYKTELMNTYAPSSVNSIVASLNSFFTFLEHPELKMRSMRMQQRIFMNKEKELTKGEYERLLAAAKKKSNNQLYYLMQTICSTGIRVSEVQHITVEAVTAGCMWINCKGKMRVVILPETLCRMLKAFVKEQKIKSGPVFVTRNGKPLDRSNIWHAMKRLCGEAHVSEEKVFPHNLRHLFARTYYSKEKDIVRLADVLGHSSINTTRIYTMETGEVHRQQLENLGLLRC